MSKAWITTSSPHIRAVVNPLNAACQQGFVPDILYVLENPGIEEEIEQALDLSTAIINAYGKDDPEINVTMMEDDVEFDRIHAHIRDAIKTVNEQDDAETAVDITPGRKYMSAIAFTAGIEYNADHVFYFYLTSADYYGNYYPDIPRTAVRLYDFTEELQ